MRRIFSSKTIILFLFIAGILLLVFLNFKGFLDMPKNLAYRIFLPVQRILYKGGNATANFASTIFSSFSMNEKNKELEKKIRVLQGELVVLSEVRLENEELRKQLGFEPPENFDVIPANVAGKDPNNLEQHIIIDKGINDGIKPGDPVVAAGGIAIGKVAEVSDVISRVLLFNDPGSTVNVLTQNSRATCLLKGSSDNWLYLEMVSQDKNIETGEQIITSGLGGIFPKGLPVGEIEEILENDIDAFKRARVKPMADSRHLEIVFVLKGIK